MYIVGSNPDNAHEDAFPCWMRRQRRLWKLAGERATGGGVLGLLGFQNIARQDPAWSSLVCTFDP